jgi:hypothetical protein
MRASSSSSLCLVALAAWLGGCASAPPPHPIVAAAPPADVATPAPDAASPPRAAPPPAEAPPESASSPATRSRETSPHYERQLNRIWGWVSLAVGVQAVGLAVGTSVMMLHQNDLRKADCEGKACSAAGLNANAELASLSPWNIGSWVVGAAGLGIGAYLLLTHPSDKELGVQVGVAPGGVLLRGAF